ncbi:MAG: hypothetical protein K2N34_08460 [Lachnospiraceae bacterium]|nr:hypothetical protein [Lachnospiraceae bacterium]
MAKNYSLTEAVQIIVENEDAAQITELGRRFPLLVSKITRLATKAGEELNDLMQFMPENLSANKVNQGIKKALEEDGSVDADDEDFEDDAEEETPASKSKQVAKGNGKKKTTDEEVADEGDTDYDSWNNAKMYKYLGEIGKRKDCKEKMGGFSHDQMLKYLKKYGPDNTASDDEDFEEEAEEQVSYDGMSAVELYKLCKERKVKADPKKPAKYYVSLLKKADEEAAQAEDDAEEDEDWDDEEETPAPKAKGKPAAKGKSKQVKKEEEDDEDWDI